MGGGNNVALSAGLRRENSVLDLVQNNDKTAIGMRGLRSSRTNGLLEGLWFLTNQCPRFFHN
jgi:hypothetical protein